MTPTKFTSAIALAFSVIASAFVNPTAGHADTSDNRIAAAATTTLATTTTPNTDDDSPARHELASRVAAIVDPANAAELTARLDTAWTQADKNHQIALYSALTQYGVPYQVNTSNPGVSFDCSGLTMYAWAQAGVELPRQSGQQRRQATNVNHSNADAGDLVWYPGHVMLYLGVDDLVLHSPRTGDHVRVGRLGDRQYWILNPAPDVEVLVPPAHPSTATAATT